jgi:hypothetical protein
MRVHDVSARPNAASGGQTVNGPKPGPVSGEWHLNPPRRVSDRFFRITARFRVSA